MHALHRQHLTITPKQNALRYRGSVCNGRACPQRGYYSAAKAAIVSSKVRCAPLKQQAANDSSACGLFSNTRSHAPLHCVAHIDA
jgi:hypothetical protein